MRIEWEDEPSESGASDWANLERRFAELLIRLLAESNIPARISDGFEPLLLELIGNGSSAYLLPRLYSSFTAPDAAVNASIEWLTQQASGKAVKIIFATLSRVAPAVRRSLSERVGVIFYDYDILLSLIESAPDLRGDYQAILRETYSLRSEPVPPARARSAPSLASGRYILQDEALPKRTRGHDLCDELDAVAVGNGSAFERACFRALTYLLEDDFAFLRRKDKSDTGMHIYDAVGKISSDKEFWLSLIDDFRGRYVVFEFKNHKDDLTQTQVYTTEKYLYPGAMRGVAILISNSDFGTGAKKAIRGALRESAKLIIPVTAKQLCEMLKDKDYGRDWTSTLATTVDGILTALER